MDACPWRAPLAAALLMLVSVACQRGLQDAPCPCASGWTCCATTNRCLPQAQALLCGDLRDAQADRPEAARGDGPDSSVSWDGGAGAGGALGGHGGLGGGAGGQGGGSLDNPPPDVPGLCTSEGWCWTHPLPTGDRFVQAFGIGTDEVWTVSAAGTIVRFRQDGTWSAVPSPMASVYTLWGLSSDDVWAGGAQGVFRWNGHAWVASPIGTGPSSRAVYAIWGCAAEDVWGVGLALGHWSKGAWSYPTLPPSTAQVPAFKAVWGSACNDVWAGGTVTSTGAGAIIHWDGAAWSTSADVPSETIVGTGAQSIWSLGRGALSRWDGLVWAPFPSDHTVWNLFAVGAGQVGTLDDTHLVTLFDGLMPSPLGPAPADVTSIWGRAAADLWGVGGPGAVVRSLGSRWDTVLAPWSLTSGAGTRVTATSSRDLWAAVGGALLHGDGSTWRTALTPAQTGGLIWDIWAPAANDVRVLGGDGVIHRWNGTWTTDVPPPAGGTSSVLRAISGSGPKDVWVLRGGDTVLHWDGTTWVSRQPSQLGNLADIWAAGPDEAWVVGDGVGHWLTGEWVPIQVPAQVRDSPFRAVDGGGGGVFFLAGTYVLRASDDGKSLSIVALLSFAPTAMHVVGPGDAWFLVQEPGLTRVYHAAGPNPGDVTASSVAPAGMNDIWADTDGTLWVAGEGGALLKQLPR